MPAVITFGSCGHCREPLGLAYADISTGEFFTTQASNLEQLTQELIRLQP